MKEKFSNAFGTIQKIGPALMTGVALIPFGGVMMALGTVFTNADVIAAMPFLGTGIFAVIASLLNTVGGLIINNLGFVFCMSMALNFCDKDGVAVISAVLAYMSTHLTISTILGITAESAAANWTIYTTTLGIPTLSMGVFGGLVVGGVTSWVYHKFKDTDLPTALSFFSRKKLVPIMAIVFGIVLGAVLSVVWPVIQGGINAFLGQFNSSSDVPSIPLLMIMLGAVTVLLPFGLHTLSYVIWAFMLGSYVTKAGTTVNGWQTIYYAQMADGVPTTTGFILAGNYISCGILMATGLAFIAAAKPKNKVKTRSMMSGGILTAFLTGISEPITFSYLFSCVPLYILQAVYGWIGMFICKALNISVGVSFVGGIIEFLIYGPIQGGQNWPLLIVVTLIHSTIWFFLLKWMIKKFHWMVPGQEDELDEDEIAEIASGDDRRLAEELIDVLGGAENIDNVDACATRLRISLKNINGLTKDSFAKYGASGTLVLGNNLQVIFGARAAALSTMINSLLKNNRRSTAAETAEEKPVTETLVSPAAGKLIPLNEIPDQVFSDGILGTGFGVEPESGEIFAPVSGTVTNVFPTKHAITFLSDNGNEILLHIGIDTVDLKGEPFEVSVNNNDHVKAGQPVAKADLQMIKDRGLHTTVAVIFTNIPEYAIIPENPGTIKAAAAIAHHFDKQ